MNTESALGVAVTYSEVLNGDSIEYDLQNRRTNETYGQWKALADEVLKRNNLKYFYVMNISYNDSIEYYISAEDHMGQINFLDKDAIGEFNVDMIKSLQRDDEVKMSFIEYTEKYGWLVSSYVPVKNSKGKVVAFVGADKDMSDLNNDIENLAMKLIMTSVLLVIFVFAIAMYVIRKLFIAPINSIVKSADNFNLLNISFNNMNLTHIKEYDLMIESFRKMEKKINRATEKSFTDDLTKLKNRYFFTLSLENILKPVTKIANLPLQKKTIAFFIIDLDYFKKINDTYGHDKGDFVLKGMGIILKELFGDMSGVVARLGGDEFAICVEIPSVAEEKPDIKILDKKCAELKLRLSQIKCSENEAGVSASVGIAVASFSTDAPLYSDVFNSADVALYRVKARGRNGWEVLYL
ncbi:hypothetical protein AGMMS49938_16280 [Fibrobacterales bacterium]|nr:hypothetical protein AGMMS49938_16280 [Fibrobacterales bacterium]